MVIEPTTNAWTSPTATQTATTATALPTNVPKIIYPDDPNTPAAAGTTPIQIGFLYPLNYIFVASNTVAAAQIFKYLPQALANAAGIDVEKVQVAKLIPYDTRAQWGYVTTLAVINYPDNLVDKLQLDMSVANSAIYNNPDPIVRNLTALINPKISIYGQVNDGGSAGGSSGSAGGANGGAAPPASGSANNDAFGTSSSDNQTSSQKAKTAGIALGSIGLGALYGGAMFIIARRYKRKKQSHRRSSSIGSDQRSSGMQYTGNGSPALMGGALMSRDMSSYGGTGIRNSHNSGTSSARTANISAPVAAENSLGWN
jgi:hypothetical protein